MTKFSELTVSAPGAYPGWPYAQLQTSKVGILEESNSLCCNVYVTIVYIPVKSRGSIKAFFKL